MTLIGFNFSFPFLPLFIQELGVTDRSELALWTGVVVGTGGISMALISPVWGLLADRFGRKAMLVRSVASGSVVLALQASVGHVGQLVGTRMLQGAFTGTQTAASMLFAGIVPPNRTGIAFGMLNTAVQVGNLIGPVLGGIVVVAIGLRSSFLVGAALLAACAIVTVLYVQDGPRPRREHLPTGVRGNLRDVFVPFGWPGLRGVLIVGGSLHVVYSGSAAVLAIYVQDLARPVWLTTELAVGLAFALGALAAAVAMPILGSHADRHDPRKLLVVSLGVVAAALVPQTIVPSAVVLLLCRIPVGVGIAGATCAIAVLTRMGAPAGAEGRAFGALATAQNLGWGFGPIVGSMFAAAVGIPALYVVAAALMTLILIVVSNSPTWFARRTIEAHPPVIAVMGADPAD